MIVVMSFFSAVLCIRFRLLSRNEPRVCVLAACCNNSVYALHFSVCPFVSCAFQGRLSYGLTKRDASCKFKGG